MKTQGSIPFFGRRNVYLHPALGSLRPFVCAPLLPVLPPRSVR